MRNSRANAARNKRREQLENLKKAKEGGLSRTELLELDDGEDVFELLDESEYQQLVEKRRESSDFVVDDENLGYFDDGEEHLGVADDATDAKKRTLEAIVDGKAYKKAKRLGSEAVPNPDKSQSTTMLSFIRPGQSTKSLITPAVEMPDTLDLDDLVNNIGKSSNPKVQSHSKSRHRLSENPRQVLTSAHEEERFAVDDEPSFEFSSYDPTPETETVFQPPSVQEAEPTPVKERVSAPKVSLTETKKKFKPSNLEEPKGDGLLHTVSDYFKDQLGHSMHESTLSNISSGASSLTIDPSWWLASDATSGEEYVPMFWTDATEVSGVVYLFGRVAVSEPGGPKRYLSCCVAVYGCERNLFVLPRKKEGQRSDGTQVRSGMSEVYQDIHRLLVPHIIPRGEGQGFRCKSVKRKYAFEMETIPREETEYMKVVYSARHSTPSADQCSPTHDVAPSIEKIFGASIGALEWFLLKRKLMGPSWILIKKPKVLPDSVSWCKIEIGVDDPKSIQKMPPSEAPPSPPLTVMSISMKTAINPSTHTHEVISLAAVVHPKVDADSDTVIASEHVKGFCFIRQLGSSCGGGYPHSFPHDIESELSRSGGGMLMTCPNERALLSAFFTRLHTEDPDVLASHNLFGFEFDVLLSRAIACKLPTWNKIGRLRRAKTPKSINDRDVASGRLLSDTYKASKEFLRETTYSLSHLALTQLKSKREEVDPVDVPRYFSDSQNIVKLGRHTLNDAGLVLGLVIKLQVIPLTKQLTNLSGNLWARTMRGARAERIEYLLLHEFHSLKYILPERRPMDHSSPKERNHGHDDDDEAAPQKVGGHARARAKAAYTGGLVLEPKKGLYDTYVLLLDFNSLYPSLIQEYNLCFTTVEWTKYNKGAIETPQEPKAALEDDDEAPTIEVDSNTSLPPIPDSHLPQGILPRVIKTLVDRRREVKALLKKAKESSLRQQLDIRQKALKLTANSMYGCLGFSFSRFYAMPIAALVTAKGREALQRTVDQAKNQMGLDVIYGDTDSVMINTGLTNLAEVNSIGIAVKKEVNKLYKCLELDIDGVFKSILLLKKKKYAALTIVENPDGSVSYEKEMKGLDLVRRDWCPISKDAGKFTIDRILSGESREDIVLQIHEYLNNLSVSIREGAVDISQFVITKGLNKSPKDYPDVKGQPHLQVALKMLKANKPVNIGDHIPYVICKAEEGQEKASPAERAHHPEEVTRSDGNLVIDFEWYLSQQILPPISRLCEPIEGTSQAIISQQLGLDSSRYLSRSGGADDVDDGWGFTPRCNMDDTERFKNCAPLVLLCLGCQQELPFTGVFNSNNGSGLSCSCSSLHWGRSERDLYYYIQNRITLSIRSSVQRYYDCWLVCDDHTCLKRTKQVSVAGFACTERSCRGRMIQEYDDTALFNQLKFLENLFDCQRAVAKRSLKMSDVPLNDQQIYEALKSYVASITKTSGYNWVRPTLWSHVFG